MNTRHFECKKLPTANDLATLRSIVDGRSTRKKTAMISFLACRNVDVYPSFWTTPYHYWSDHPNNGPFDRPIHSQTPKIREERHIAPNLLALHSNKRNKRKRKTTLPRLRHNSRILPPESSLKMFPRTFAASNRESTTFSRHAKSKGKAKVSSR